MARLISGLLCAALMLCASAARSQEGHPLTGTWSGDWGPDDSARHHVTLVITWDGKTVGGTINPGPDAVTVNEIELDVTAWTIRFAVDAKSAGGTAERIEVEGALENIGSSHRTLAGTWRQGTEAGAFRLTRD